MKLNLKNKAKKYSPELLLGAGIVGIISGTIMACKATPKAVQIMEEANQTLDTIHEVQKTTEEEVYTPQDFRKDIALTYIQTAGKLIRTYGPSVLVLITGIGLVFGSHHILSKRNAAITAAYTLVNQGYSEYRKRVAEKFGEEVEKQIRYNIVEEETEETIVDDKGKEKKKKDKKTVVNDICASPYAKFFDAASREWVDDMEANLTKLKILQGHFNKQLENEGFLCLNDVYKALDIPTTRAGQIVGWWLEKGETPHVDFGVFGPTNKRAVNLYEDCILLDFNVDGEILSHIG